MANSKKQLYFTNTVINDHK